MDATESEQGRNRGSLAGRAVAAARDQLAMLRSGRSVSGPPRPHGRHDRWIAAGLALLLASGPLATIIGAKSLAGRARAEAARLDATASPRIAAQRVRERDRAELATALRRPTVGATIEAIAQVLPPEAALLRAERNRDGLLEVEVRTPDPDKLRTALRRQPLLAGLRDAGQRQADAAMIVSYRQVQP